MKVSGELYGEWDKLDRILKNLQNNRREYHDAVRIVGEKISEAIVQLIESQSLDMQPLVKEYAAKKRMEGTDPRILIRTKDFLNSIQVTDIQADGYDMMVQIGVVDGMTVTGIRMQELAYYLEYGTRNMPARAPFQKSWEKMREDVKDEILGRLKSIIQEDIR